MQQAYAAGLACAAGLAYAAGLADALACIASGHHSRKAIAPSKHPNKQKGSTLEQTINSRVNPAKSRVLI